MPLRVSLVPPDLEITTVSVVAKRPCSVASTRSMPSGSVLSKKWGRSLSWLVPSASATSSGPSAEPPMPMVKMSVKAPPWPTIFPVCTSRANASTLATTSRISLRSSVGARRASRSQ